MPDGSPARGSALARTAALTLAAGLAYGLAPEPTNLPVLAFGGGAFLWAALDGVRTPRAAALVGLGASFLANGLVLGWFVPMMATYGGVPAGVPILAGSVVFAAQSIPFMLAGAWCVALRPAAPDWVTLPVALPAALSLVPLLFPWHLSLSALGCLPYVQCDELSGPVTADVPLLFVGTAAGFGWKTRSWRALAVAAFALALPYASGVARLAEVRAQRASWPALRVGMVQPSFDIPQRFAPPWFPEQIHVLHAATRRLEARGAELVVWPETSYPFLVDHALRVETWQSPLAILGEGVRGPLLVGIVMTAPPGPAEIEDRQFNTVVSVRPDRTFAGLMDKIALVPFSEHVPFWEEMLWTHRFIPSGGVTPGTSQHLLPAAGTEVLILNCYEDVLSEYTARGARLRPGLLVNMTNDAWFGRTEEPALHDAVARLRTIETRTDLVRTVSIGPTTHTAATGEELHRTRGWVRAAYVTTVRLRPKSAPRTLYVVAGDWLTPLLCVVLLGWAAGAVRAGRRRKTALA